MLRQELFPIFVLNVTATKCKTEYLITRYLIRLNDERKNVYFKPVNVTIFDTPQYYLSEPVYS